MTADLRTATPEMPLTKVLDILRVNCVSGLPVVEDGNLVGILSIEDIVRASHLFEMSFRTAQPLSFAIRLRHKTLRREG